MWGVKDFSNFNKIELNMRFYLYIYSKTIKKKEKGNSVLIGIFVF